MCNTIDFRSYCLGYKDTCLYLSMSVYLSLFISLCPPRVLGDSLRVPMASSSHVTQPHSSRRALPPVITFVSPSRLITYPLPSSPRIHVAAAVAVVDPSWWPHPCAVVSSYVYAVSFSTNKYNWTTLLTGRTDQHCPPAFCLLLRWQKVNS